MANSFSSLRNNTSTAFAKLTEEVAKLNSNAPQEDERFWKPSVDKAGNGFAIIRFLPAAASEDVPFVRIWDHAFKGSGGWYIEKSLTTLGEADPVSEYNMELWNTGIESNKKIVRDQKRRLSFISNIYIVKDSANPDNEGKVFLYRYGKKIFDKVNAAMHPEFEDEKPLNPFDLWEGANFKLKIRKVEGYQNYDKSEFDTPSRLFDSDQELEDVWNKEHALQPFLARTEFKTYDQLKARLYKVLGLDGSAPKPSTTADDNEVHPPSYKARAAASAAAISMATVNDVGDDDDDSINFFKKMVDE